MNHLRSEKQGKFRLLRTVTRLNLRPILINATSKTFVIRIASLGLNFVINVVLARLLGVSDYGAVAYAMAWVNILIVPALFGFEELLVRDIAVYHAKSAWHLMRGVIQTAHLISLIVSIVIAVVVWRVSESTAAAPMQGAIISFEIWDDLAAAWPTNYTAVYAIWIAMAILPVFAFIRLQSSILRGLRQIVVSQVPDTLMRPLLLLAVLVGAYLFSEDKLTAPQIMALRGIIAVIVLGYSIYAVLRALPDAVKHGAAAYEFKPWMQRAIPLFGMGLLSMIHSRADVLMLGALRGVEEVASYSVALLLSSLAILILASANTALAPAFAELFASGDLDRLQQRVTRTTRAVLLASLPLVLILGLFGQFFLSIFGPEYVQAYPALLILLVGQCANLVSGPNSILLVMTGQERPAVTGSAVGAGLYVILNLLLIPSWGMIGAALATTLSMMTWTMLLNWFAWRRIRIDTTVLGRKQF
jgi:O-antigen/teichoic acid export membrane protein